MPQVKDLLIYRPSPRRRGRPGRVLQDLVRQQTQGHEHKRAVRPDDAVVGHGRSNCSRRYAQTPVMDVVEKVWMTVSVEAEEVSYRMAGNVGVRSVGEELLDLL